MQDIPRHIEQLITKQLDGSLSNVEQGELQQWLNESEENQKLFEVNQQIWIHAQKVNTDAAWEKVSAQLDQSGRINKNESKGFHLQPWLNRAAIIIAICLISFITYLLLDQQSETLVAVKAETEVKELRLSDSSQISLNVGAILEYPEAFESKKRKVKLIGEAFFKVEHAAKRPFIIDANEVDVEVLGTSFFVNSPENGQKIEVGVKSGKVSVTSKETGEQHILTKGQKAKYLVATAEFILVEVAPKDLLWQDSALLYNLVPLPQVFSDLEEKFEVTINYKIEDFSACQFSGRFNTKSLEDILEQISLSYDFSFEKTDSGYHLKGKPRC